MPKTTSDAALTESYFAAHKARREAEERERIARLVERKHGAEARVAEAQTNFDQKHKAHTKAAASLEHAAQSATVRRYNAAQDIAIQLGCGHAWKLYAMWLTSARSRREMVATEAPAPSWPKELVFNDDERQVIKQYLHLKVAAQIASVERIDALRAVEEAASAVAEIERELAQ